MITIAPALRRTLLTSVALLLAGIAVYGQDHASDLEELFTRESFTFGNTTLPYRCARIAAGGPVLPALVLYLHGGTSRGSDNEAPLSEKAVADIYQYLSAHNMAATFIVPQCPENDDWAMLMHHVVYELLCSYLTTRQAHPGRVYVLGGSMGGTGTWNQLSYFPDFYAAAMPVAGNPEGLSAENVAKTPVLTVMGTDDVIMSIQTVQDFQSAVIAAGGTMRLDIETGWSHQNTCEQSYTEERLRWLFSHTRSNPSGIRDVNLNLNLNDNDSDNDNENENLKPGTWNLKPGTWNLYYDLSGRCATQPSQGLYIHNGKKIFVP